MYMHPWHLLFGLHCILVLGQQSGSCASFTPSDLDLSLKKTTVQETDKNSKALSPRLSAACCPTVATLPTAKARECPLVPSHNMMTTLHMVQAYCSGRRRSSSSSTRGASSGTLPTPLPLRSQQALLLPQSLAGQHRPADADSAEKGADSQTWLLQAVHKKKK
ncbi:hypothetical protein GN956_G22919 [Arapaima gigas]